MAHEASAHEAEAAVNECEDRKSMSGLERLDQIKPLLLLLCLVAGCIDRLAVSHTNLQHIPVGITFGAGARTVEEEMRLRCAKRARGAVPS